MDIKDFCHQLYAREIGENLGIINTLDDIDVLVMQMIPSLVF